MKVVCYDCRKTNPTHERPRNFSLSHTVDVCKECYDAWMKEQNDHLLILQKEEHKQYLQKEGENE